MHTKEPWAEYKYKPRQPASEFVVMSQDDYERARACVNACAGVPTEWLESGESTIEYYELKAQRDKLLIQIKWISDHVLGENEMTSELDKLIAEMEHA